MVAPPLHNIIMWLHQVRCWTGDHTLAGYLAAAVCVVYMFGPGVPGAATIRSPSILHSESGL